MDKLNRVRETTKQIITKLAERNTNDLHDPHPYGFELNAEQWAHFIAIHETRISDSWDVSGRRINNR
ncbi:hypothetical protein V4V36_04150 [Paenibacillus lautus]|uniref:hypothetical protein n=1 Tax=Paenibacillus lautus TaxID=1401 RepID=UPI002FBE98E1